jgi:hypothetical protein
MAIVIFGGGVAGIRGTLAGATFSANKSGPYARSWSRGANVRSQRQTSQRASIAALAAQWRTIDPADQADWNTYAADPLNRLRNSLGQFYYISGFLWWVKVSRDMITCDRLPVEACTPGTWPPAPTILTLRVSAGAPTSQITYPLFTFEPTFDCVIEMAIGQSIGAIAKPITPLLLDGYQTPGLTSLDISAAIAERFTLPALGQKAFAEVSRQRVTGRRGAPYAISVDVVA